MPTASASCTYKITQSGAASSAALQGLVSSVPLPIDELRILGVRVLSDTVVAGPPIERIVVLGLTPSVDATATVSLEPATPTGSPILAVNVTGAGADYIVPPAVFVHGNGRSFFGRALLKVATAAVTAPGSGYAVGTTPIFFGGLAPMTTPWPHGPPPGNLPRATVQFREVFSVTLGAAGAGYSPQTRAVFSGGLCPNPRGRPAAGVAIVRAGAIVDVLITDPGNFYVSPPQVTFVDPTGFGTGATATVTQHDMIDGPILSYAGRFATGTVTLNGGGGVTGITITDHGEGYVSAPTIVAVDPTGAGDGLATFSDTMSVGIIQVRNGGFGFSGTPTVEVLPFFKTLFPDTCDQRKPFFELITAALQEATRCPVVALPPVVA